MDVVRDPEMDAGMPPGAIEDEHDLLAGTRPCLMCKCGELHLKDGDTHRRGQMKDGPSGGGMDEADEPAPGKAVLDQRHGSLAPRRPEAAQERLQADAMFVGGPEFDLGVGKGGGDRLQQGPYLFLKVSCCSRSAKACCGRGTCWLCLSRWR